MDEYLGLTGSKRGDSSLFFPYGETKIGEWDDDHNLWVFPGDDGFIYWEVRVKYRPGSTGCLNPNPANLFSDPLIIPVRVPPTRL